jgi:hypothetical protein
MHELVAARASIEHVFDVSGTTALLWNAMVTIELYKAAFLEMELADERRSTRQ